MEITLPFGLSFSLKHSFQTQLHNQSRRSWLNIADVCFSLFDTISLSDWRTPYCLSLLDMNFTRWLNNSILLCFSHFCSQKSQNIPAQRNRYREVDSQNTNTVLRVKTQKHMFVSHCHCSCQSKNNRKRKHKLKSCFHACSIELVFISYSLLAIQEFCSVLLFFHNSSPEYSLNHF